MLCRNTLPYIVVRQLRRKHVTRPTPAWVRQASEGNASGRHQSTWYQFSPKPSIVIFILQPSASSRAQVGRGDARVLAISCSGGPRLDKELKA